MAVLEHRLQILLDDRRYRRVQELAQERGTSIASVIREAIDRGLPSTDAQRRAAADAILSAPPMPVPADPADLKAELDELRSRRA